MPARCRHRPEPAHRPLPFALAAPPPSLAASAATSSPATRLLPSFHPTVPPIPERVRALLALLAPLVASRLTSPADARGSTPYGFRLDARPSAPPQIRKLGGPNRHPLDVSGQR